MLLPLARNALRVVHVRLVVRANVRHVVVVLADAFVLVVYVVRSEGLTYRGDGGRGGRRVECRLRKKDPLAPVLVDSDRVVSDVDLARAVLDGRSEHPDKGSRVPGRRRSVSPLTEVFLPGRRVLTRPRHDPHPSGRRSARSIPPVDPKYQRNKEKMCLLHTIKIYLVFISL